MTPDRKFPCGEASPSNVHLVRRDENPSIRLNRKAYKLIAPPTNAIIAWLLPLLPCRSSSSSSSSHHRRHRCQSGCQTHQYSIFRALWPRLPPSLGSDLEKPGRNLRFQCVSHITYFQCYCAGECVRGFGPKV